MRYTPHTTADCEQMLRAIGIESIEALYQHVPASPRQRSKINLPEGVSEFSLRQRLARLASCNATPSEWSLFLGGGIYHHFIPSAVDAIISRAEFATSYTPYQPEVSQGRSEEHTSELQSRFGISSAVFCFKKKTGTDTYTPVHPVTPADRCSTQLIPH